MAFAFEETEVPVGEQKWIDVTVTKDADGSDITIPFCLIHNGPGPTLWVQGCVHGPEQVGCVAIREFLQGIKPGSIDGTIIATPIVNRPAFAAKQREAPLDFGDLNRSFPGDPNGTFTQQLANLVFELSKEHADYFVDLHTGGNEFMIPGYSIFAETDDETETVSRELAFTSDLPYAVGIEPDQLTGALFNQLSQSGIPSVITETGGEGRLHGNHLTNAIKAIQNIAKHVNILPGEPSREVKVNVHSGLEIMNAPVGGIFEPKVSGNQKIQKGDLLAEITDIKGDKLATIKSPLNGVVIAVRTYAVARPGDWIFELTPA